MVDSVCGVGKEERPACLPYYLTAISNANKMEVPNTIYVRIDIVTTSLGGMGSSGRVVSPRVYFHSSSSFTSSS
jgi:hypothetical protein